MGKILKKIKGFFRNDYHEPNHNLNNKINEILIKKDMIMNLNLGVYPPNDDVVEIIPFDEAEKLINKGMVVYTKINNYYYYAIKTVNPYLVEFKICDIDYYLNNYLEKYKRINQSIPINIDTGSFLDNYIKTYNSNNQPITLDTFDFCNLEWYIVNEGKYCDWRIDKIKEYNKELRVLHEAIRN